MKFRWNPGLSFNKINQIEMDDKKFMISVSIERPIIDRECDNVLGIDLNCGRDRSVANCVNLRSGEVLNLGKQGPNIRRQYFMKRKKQKIKSNKEHRKLKDLDHKISRTIVKYALKHKLKIVMENLKGIRTNKVKGNGMRAINRTLNSWSFYRLQQFVEYKSKEHCIPFIKINPQYTSRECNRCGIIGERDRDKFVCLNKHCKGFKKIIHSDINAAYNIGKRSLYSGGTSPE